MKTFTPKPADLTHDWYIIDATDVVLGRLATQVATLLRGKNKPTYAPHADSGNHVIIINADKIALTGNKMGKELYSHSGRPGGLRRDSYAELLANKPERIIKAAVKGMLPKNRLSKVQLDRLRIFRGAEHPHTALTRHGSLTEGDVRRLPGDLCATLLSSGVTLPDIESQLLEFAVQQSRGNLSAAARQLGLTRPQLAYRLQRSSQKPS